MGKAPRRNSSRWLPRLAPGLAALLAYRRGDLPGDLVAGVSVAAVALPVGIAYAQLAGFSPVVGLYASILPLLVYALFGTSRQLIVGPDAATCALIASALVPLAGGDSERYLSLSVALAGLTGVFCILASFIRLGALADFLSKPILVGFLNGISLHILAGQLGKLAAVPVTAPGVVPATLQLLEQYADYHWPTLLVGLTAFAVLLLSPRLLPRLPAALLALVVAAALVAVFGLDQRGVAVIGAVPAGLPELKLPDVPWHQVDELVAAALGLALVSFSSMMLTARSFAAKNHYEIDADREFAALGAANLAAALTQSFAISGADSRTAMSDAAGGRTQLAGVIAALSIAAVLLFLSEPLRFVPIAALAAVLIIASLSLLDVRSLVLLLRFSRIEFAFAMLATLGVVWVGAIKAILVVLILSLIRFVMLSSRPRVDVLGKVAGISGFHHLANHPEATTWPGLLLLRFNAPLVFFNANYFKQQVERAVERAGDGLHWLVLDAMPITQMDVTGYFAVEELRATLRRKGIQLAVAGRYQEIMAWRKAHALDNDDTLYFPTMRKAVKAFLERQAGGEAGQG
ncbi:high affinity sulphate transporter 1 [Geopseudomonas sagittaria]|uniref:High affinity sulphate transporter 1 n=1 Tax=Geopseudomonas sagittaria TaxID=1135990 RepID=A0A1I5Y5H8_9GAMM|nr:sulfate permease [Pseudomonas sagittaria]SFQ39448.1 high affinity sulphate transporter 1 [Pseudomonas sagittaria]